MECVLLLSTLEPQEIEACNINQLKYLCKTEKLSESNNADDMVQRLILKKYGVSSKFVSESTKCQFCKSQVKVLNVRIEQENKAVVIVRRIKCAGPRCHIYQLREKAV
jgi:hypothetical protein